MTGLVEINNNELRVSTFKLWKYFGYGEHRALKRLISDNKKSFLEFGILRFENTKLESTGVAGRPDKSFLLNESQCMFLITMIRADGKANKLKVRLIKEFKQRGDELRKIHETTEHIEEIRKIFLLDTPSEWVNLFPPDFFKRH